MPCWSIHLGVSYEVNKKYKYDKDLVYFGSILPDFLNRDYSHYYKNHVIDFDSFLNDYKNNLDNPLIIGYYIHLLTDYYFNSYVSDNCWIYDNNNNVIGIKLINGEKMYNDDKKYLRDFKQNDFKNFGSYLVNNNLLEYPIDSDKIYNTIKELNIKLNKRTIIDKINYFKSDDFYNYNTYNGYKLFNKETYDKIYNDCIDYIISKINNISL